MFGTYVSGLPGRGPFAEGVLRVGITDSIDIASIVPGGTTIWGENIPYPWDWATGPLSIVSTSANDTAGGTGARSLYIGGLDANMDSISEVVAMAGLTPVPTVQSFSRVNESFVVESGSSGWNEGIIRARSGAAIAMRMNALAARNNQAVWTVPGDWLNGAVLLRYWADMSNKQTAVAVSKLRFRLPGSNTWQLLGGFATGTNGGSASYISQVPLPIPAGTDINGVVTDLSTNGVSLTATFELMRHS